MIHSTYFLLTSSGSFSSVGLRSTEHQTYFDTNDNTDIINKVLLIKYILSAVAYKVTPGFTIKSKTDTLHCQFSPINN